MLNHKKIPSPAGSPSLSKKNVLEKFKHFIFNAKYKFRAPKKRFFLVVDDNQVNRMLAKKKLEKLSSDIEVHVASNGEDAHKMIEQRIIQHVTSYDVILLDNQMGKGWDGEQTATEIRKLEADKKIYGEKESFIITWSSDKDRITPEQKYEHANALLSKPLDQNQLTTLLVQNNILSPYTSPQQSPCGSPKKSPPNPFGDDETEKLTTKFENLGLNLSKK